MVVNSKTAFRTGVVIFSWILLTAQAAGVLHAQSGPPLLIQRLSGSLTVDGVIDEAAWRTIQPMPLVMYEPIAKGKMSEKTEIRLTYDDRFIYVGARLFTRDPSGIRADSYDRDDWEAEGDFFNFVLDTFNDNENAVSFSTTPTGMRQDSEITNDAEGDWLNTSWNMFWSAAASRDDKGWSAELRIPFSSLRFNGNDGRVEMGLTLNRFIASSNERYIFPAIEPTSEWALYKPSNFQTVVFEGIDAGSPLYVSPYVLMGVRQASSAGPASDLQVLDPRWDLGLDVKHGLANSLALDLTVNTDFAQVEADDQQINLTRFSLFFPEKRLFFQERSGIFQFDLGRDGRLFHSRRIGLTESGQPVRILGGARLTGRVGAWDLGLMEMQTSESPSLPSENFGVLRLRRPIVNAYSYVGTMITSRIGLNGNYSMAYGVDGRWRVVGDEYLTASLAHSTNDDGRIERNPLFSGGNASLGWQRRTDVGPGYDLLLTYSGHDFAPGVGFSNRTGFTLAEQRVSYGWFADDDSIVRFYLPSIRNAVYFRTDDGSVESALQEVTWSIDFKNGASGEIRMRRQKEDLRTSFVLSDAAGVPPGSYSFYTAGATYTTPSWSHLRGSADVEAGTFFDGHRTAMQVQSLWIASAHLRLELELQGNWLRFPRRAQQFTAHLGRLKLKTSLNRRLSARTLLQYNQVDQSWTTNLRFRYNAREGTDLYIVLNRQQRRAEYAERLDQLPTARSAIVAKFTHTFR
jgi:hypothetical protein